MSYQQPHGRTLGSQPSNMRGKILMIFMLGLGTGTIIGFLLGRTTGQKNLPAELPNNPPEFTSVESTKPPTKVTEPGAGVYPTNVTNPAPSDEMKMLDLSIKRSLYDTLGQHLNRREADVLNAQLGRILVWWVNLSRDVLNQDRLQVIYRPSENENDMIIMAIRYTSTKNRKTYFAYNFKPQGAKYSRYYDAEGKEIETRLQDGPIDQYEQITELMDLTGRRHKGVDFKCEVGTNVSTPFRARVSRRNWNTRRNGNCLELVYLSSGITAIFLHLDEILPVVRSGKVLEAGTLVATTGNTGRSTAPHLHYELHSSKGRLLNPFEVHKITTKRIVSSQLTEFTAHRKRLDQIFDRKDSAEGLSQRSSESNVSMVKAR